MEADVLYELSDSVAVITLNRPARLNSLTADAIALLAKYTHMAQENSQVRAVVITGSGDASFSVGGDLGDLIPRLLSGEGSIIVPDITKRFFADLFKPVIAAVNGLCIGGGLEIMLGSDLRIVGDQAQFGLGEVRIGVVPGAGSHVRLPRQIPWAIAMQLLLTGEPIGAQRAYEVGLVNEVLPPDQVLGRAVALARAISANGPLAVQTAKEIAVRAMSLEAGFTLEGALTERVMRSQDAREGPQSFLERRPPRFTGN